MKTVQNFPLLRGMDARITMAHAHIAFVIYGDKAPNDAAEAFDAYLKAQNQGFTDFKAGISEIPMLFKDEPILVDGWKSGFAAGYECSLSPVWCGEWRSMDGESEVRDAVYRTESGFLPTLEQSIFGGEPFAITSGEEASTLEDAKKACSQLDFD